MVSNSTRRQFLASAAAMGATLAWASAQGRPSTHHWTERRDVFAHGVASGDPTPESVILWTRRPPFAGKPAAHLHVEVAEDSDFKHVVVSAAATPTEDNDWTIRVLAAGLKPSKIYWYRFTDEHGFGSRVGRTRTAPALDDPRPVNFTFVSCQDNTQSAGNAYRRMIWDDEHKAEADQLEFVMHLGDFFYELVWYPEDRPQGMYTRRLRDIVRYPHGEKHEDFHVPTDVEDYRTIFRGYLMDPDLADARARWPFICMWDNHEFSWQGYQTLENYGKGFYPAQTRKVAAAQAWFEYQPAHVRKVGNQPLDRFDPPTVSNAPITTFDDYGFGQEPNNLTAVGALTLYRAMRWGANVDLILTDNRSYRSRDSLGDDETDPFDAPNFPEAVPLELMEISDAGRAYNGGHPPDVIPYGDKKVPNWRKNGAPQSMLGREQKAWFLDRLKTSAAPWKIWGNTVGMLDVRIDYQNLPSSYGKWPGAGYGMLTTGDWSGYRTERAEIFDTVRNNNVSGLVSLAGDRHAFFAGSLSKSLPPEPFEPVGIEFVTGSVSAPTYFEALSFKSRKKDFPLKSLFLYQAPGSTSVEPAMNFTGRFGVRAGLKLAETNDIKQALAETNPDIAPHLKHLDYGGHGFVTICATPTELRSELVCIPIPLERSPTPDGGPVAYRISYRTALWKSGDAPNMETVSTEGHIPLSA